ncbi:hypothetical protein K0M31_005154 [Melipona bicolor]|uniref:Uncharacterized protein n=1 Tax=Melipona bicolor TaxID=60889 RepID=A0AA40FV11_9HYME|nr:hypothetical protein K0M31_005154 [Melipona bicolor]
MAETETMRFEGSDEHRRRPSGSQNTTADAATIGENILEQIGERIKTLKGAGGVREIERSRSYFGRSSGKPKFGRVCGIRRMPREIGSLKESKEDRRASEGIEWYSRDERRTKKREIFELE